MNMTIRLRLRPGFWLHLRHNYSTSAPKDLGKKLSEDPRLKVLGRTLSDEFSTIRENYRTPKNPIVLCHGLLGFKELHLAGQYLPSVSYWRGITEILAANGVEVIITSVPASGSIEVRAKALIDGIESELKGRSVNLIGHSMGGIDARYMISKLKPTSFKILSLTTVATPHRGSSFADYMLDLIGKKRLPRVYKAAESIGMQTGAFSQLTTKYMNEKFNPVVLNDESVQYFSYGAMTSPSVFSVFRQPHRIIQDKEGPNDGLVSVQSAQWGTYKGTLVGPSHLGIINWTNRLKWLLTGNKESFNAIAFYCDIADMLAEEGL